MLCSVLLLIGIVDLEENMAATAFGHKRDVCLVANKLIVCCDLHLKLAKSTWALLVGV